MYRADSDTSLDAQVYAANPHGHDVALDSQTGKTLYQLANAYVVVAVDNHRVYATCGSTGTHFCAYDKTTGAKLWRIDYTSVPKGQGSSNPHASIGGDVLYLDDGGHSTPLPGSCSPDSGQQVRRGASPSAAAGSRQTSTASTPTSTACRGSASRH